MFSHVVYLQVKHGASEEPEQSDMQNFNEQTSFFMMCTDTNLSYG